MFEEAYLALERWAGLLTWCCDGRYVEIGLALSRYGFDAAAELVERSAGRPFPPTKTMKLNYPGTIPHTFAPSKSKQYSFRDDIL